MQVSGRDPRPGRERAKKKKKEIERQRLTLRLLSLRLLSFVCCPFVSSPFVSSPLSAVHLFVVVVCLFLPQPPPLIRVYIRLQRRRSTFFCLFGERGKGTAQGQQVPGCMVRYVCMYVCIFIHSTALSRGFMARLRFTSSASRRTSSRGTWSSWSCLGCTRRGRGWYQSRAFPCSCCRAWASS